MTNPEDLPHTVARAIHEIAQYVSRHPDARDTLEGIRDWWLPSDISFTAAELQQALDILTGWGWLVKQMLITQTYVYGVSEAGMQQAIDFLRDKTN